MEFGLTKGGAAIHDKLIETVLSEVSRIFRPPVFVLVILLNYIYCTLDELLEEAIKLIHSPSFVATILYNMQR